MLQHIAEDIWAHQTDLRLPLGMSMPCRATILRLTDGSLVVHSPLAIDDATATEIDRLGDVRFLIAPNCLHWMYLKAAKERYPQARVFGSPGLEKKLGGFSFEPLPATGRIAGMREDIRVERIEGAPSLTEHVFLHERSRSLLVTDLFFNIHECRSFGMRTVLRVVGAWKKTAQSRALRFGVKDRQAAGRSAAEVVSWDFDRVVVGHGDIVEGDARARAAEALSWMMSGTRPLLGGGPVSAG